MNRAPRPRRDDGGWDPGLLGWDGTAAAPSAPARCPAARWAALMEIPSVGRAVDAPVG